MVDTYSMLVVLSWQLYMDSGEGALMREVYAFHETGNKKIEEVMTEIRFCSMA
jgi:hypothetical protein